MILGHYRLELRSAARERIERSETTGRKRMRRGIVKWYNDNKGYGFITPDGNSADDLENDVFVHFEAIQVVGFKSLVEGERVRFEALKGPKGEQATKVFKGRSIFG